MPSAFLKVVFRLPVTRIYLVDNLSSSTKQKSGALAGIKLHGSVDPSDRICICTKGVSTRSRSHKCSSASAAEGIDNATSPRTKFLNALTDERNRKHRIIGAQTAPTPFRRGQCPVLDLKVVCHDSLNRLLNISAPRLSGIAACACALTSGIKPSS